MKSENRTKSELDAYKELMTIYHELSTENRIQLMMVAESIAATQNRMNKMQKNSTKNG